MYRWDSIDARWMIIKTVAWVGPILLINYEAATTLTGGWGSTNGGGQSGCVGQFNCFLLNACILYKTAFLRMRNKIKKAIMTHYEFHHEIAHVRLSSSVAENSLKRIFLSSGCCGSKSMMGSNKARRANNDRLDPHNVSLPLSLFGWWESLSGVDQLSKGTLLQAGLVKCDKCSVSFLLLVD